MNDEEMVENYRRYREDLHQQRLSKNKDLIDNFLQNHSDLEDVKFDYLETIGIIAERQGILANLMPEIERDKDGLVNFASLQSLYSVSPMNEGVLIGTDHIALASPLFRRGMHPVNNWQPRFIQIFWSLNDPDIDAYIALDFDRVRINVDNSCYMEADTWFGAPFSDDIRQIKDGMAKLRPPADLSAHHLSFFFADAYSLDIQWKTNGSIKSFYALEFKGEETLVLNDGQTYHPARYIHAEFDLEQNHFRHFDGAVQYLTDEEYFERRDTDFNHDNKSKSHVKPMSQKVFKLNGKVTVEMWKEFCCHFCAANPLMYEYFAGEYPQSLQETIQHIRERHD